MSAAQETLQEFLVKLGFKTDQISLKKFEDGLGKTGKSVLKTGLAVAGLVTAVEGATVAFAYSMRKMYFDSQVSGATVSNLRAVGYAAKAVGIDAEAMQDTIKGVGINMRLSPGLQGLAKSMGINSRDPTDVTEGVVNYTLKKKMPAWVGAQYAQMFGIGAEQYLHLRDNPGVLRAKINEHKDLTKQAGGDPERDAANSLKLTSAVDKFLAILDIMKNAALGWSLDFNVRTLADTGDFMMAVTQGMSDDPKAKEEAAFYWERYRKNAARKLLGLPMSVIQATDDLGATIVGGIRAGGSATKDLLDPFAPAPHRVPLSWEKGQARLGDTTTTTTTGGVTNHIDVTQTFHGDASKAIAPAAKKVFSEASRNSKRKIE